MFIFMCFSYAHLSQKDVMEKIKENVKAGKVSCKITRGK